MIDSSDFIPVMQKAAIGNAVNEGIASELSRLVSIPRSSQFDTRASAQNVQSSIVSWMHSHGVEDIVLKPGAYGGSATTAFFYNVNNAGHVREMSITIKKMADAGVNTVIAEELVWNGSIDGKKLEVRVWCLREG